MSTFTDWIMGHNKTIIPPGHRATHTYVVGQSGTGKSRALESWIMQDILAGHGVGVIDPHGDLFRNLLYRLAAKPEVYGKGYYWRHIQKANPVAASDPTRLKPGTKLIIPPLPQRAPATIPVTSTRGLSRPSAADHGRTIVQGGRKYYIVQAGDAGYWGIAQKVYGEGRYNYLIDRANPGVDSNSLQPGKKLYIPPKPATTSGSGRRTETSAPIRSGSSVPDFGP